MPVLLRTGRWARPDQPGTPGLSASAGWDVWGLPLFKERDIAVLGSDHAQEVANNIEPPVDRLSVTAIFEQIVATELEDRHRRSVERRVDRLARVSPRRHGTVMRFGLNSLRRGGRFGVMLRSSAMEAAVEDHVWSIDGDC